MPSRLGSFGEPFPNASAFASDLSDRQGSLILVVIPIRARSPFQRLPLLKCELRKRAVSKPETRSLRYRQPSTWSTSSIHHEEEPTVIEPLKGFAGGRFAEERLSPFDRKKRAKVVQPSGWIRGVGSLRWNEPGPLTDRDGRLQPNYGTNVTQTQKGTTDEPS